MVNRIAFYVIISIKYTRINLKNAKYNGYGTRFQNWGLTKVNLWCKMTYNEHCDIKSKMNEFHRKESRR